MSLACVLSVTASVGGVTVSTVSMMRGLLVQKREPFGSVLTDKKS